MSVPNNIQNGDVPDATVLMANLNFLGDGKGIKVDTYNNLSIFAALTPTTPFLALSSDTMQLVFYCGNIAYGDGGFYIIGGG